MTNKELMEQAAMDYEKALKEGLNKHLQAVRGDIQTALSDEPEWAAQEADECTPLGFVQPWFDGLEDDLGDELFGPGGPFSRK